MDAKRLPLCSKTQFKLLPELSIVRDFHFVKKSNYVVAI